MGIANTLSLQDEMDDSCFEVSSDFFSGMSAFKDATTSSDWA